MTRGRAGLSTDCGTWKGSALLYQYARAGTKEQTIRHAYPTTKQRKYNGYSLVHWYIRTEPVAVGNVRVPDGTCLNR